MDNKRIRGSSIVLLISVLISVILLGIIGYEVIDYGELALSWYGYKLVAQLVVFAISTVLTVVLVVRMNEDCVYRKKTMYKFVVAFTVLYGIGLCAVLVRGISLDAYKTMSSEWWMIRLNDINIKPFNVFREYRNYTKASMYFIQSIYTYRDIAVSRGCSRLVYV